MSVIPSAFCSTCLLQVFISHPPTTHHPSLDLWGPLFPIKLLTPTYQSHVSAVITCVCPYLCSPHPVSKSRIRVQSDWETRSPPLLFPLSLSLCLSPWLQGCAVFEWESKVNTWALFRLPGQICFLAHPDCIRIFSFFLLESHMKCDFCKSDSNHIWRRICTDTSQSVRSNQISKCLLSHSQCEKQQWCQIQREWHQSSWADATSRAVWRTERSPGGFKMLDFHF